ncbi:MAG: SCO family protein [Acidobacteria bacterium]|nr:SCO family protein [Acidobacteriota bacterium]
MRRALLTATLAVTALFAQGQGTRPQGVLGESSLGATSIPDQVKDAAIEQRLNDPVPLDAEFTDDTGARKPLREYISKERPSILVPVYYECPMLCHMILNGVLRALRAVPLNVGKDFDVVAFSFDPSEGPQSARAKKFEYIERYNRPGTEQGWIFLTGDDANVRRLTEAIGYRYKKDESSGQWIHASGIMVVTPDGRLSKYFYGVEFSARDLRLGLVEASANKIGSVVDQVLLYCFHYDPAVGKYSLTILRIMRGAAAATFLGILAFWYISWRQNKNRNVERLPAIP